MLGRETVQRGSFWVGQPGGKRLSRSAKGRPTEDGSRAGEGSSQAGDRLTCPLSPAEGKAYSSDEEKPEGRQGEAAGSSEREEDESSAESEEEPFPDGAVPAKARAKRAGADGAAPAAAAPQEPPPRKMLQAGGLRARETPLPDGRHEASDSGKRELGCPETVGPPIRTTPALGTELVLRPANRSRRKGSLREAKAIRSARLPPVALTPEGRKPRGRRTAGAGRGIADGEHEQAALHVRPPSLSVGEV